MQSVLRYVKNEGLKLRLNLHLVFLLSIHRILRFATRKKLMYFSLCVKKHI